MPNRIIKETICTSEEIDALSAEQEVFFYRLMVNCDDYGLCDARPKIIASKCYPLKSFDIKKIQANVDALVKVGLVIAYEVDGKPYLAIAKWAEHQQIRAKRAKFPLPNDPSAIICNQAIANVPVIQSNPIQSTQSNDCIVGSDGFDEFWTVYPKKKSKGDAEKAWKKIKPSAELVEKIVSKVNLLKSTEQWSKDGGKFIPYPASWLNAMGWEDEVDTSIPATGQVRSGMSFAERFGLKEVPA